MFSSDPKVFFLFSPLEKKAVKQTVCYTVILSLGKDEGMHAAGKVFNEI